MKNIKQRQRYYEHLLSIGMPDILAASMAAQTDDPNQRQSFVRSAICCFGIWGFTQEGLDFWGGIF